MPHPSDYLRPAPVGAGPLPPTPPDILGPFYRPGSPHRAALCDRPVVTLAGRVLDRRGQPVDAYVDVWQADAEGRYDAHGPAFRGVQRTAADGSFGFGTVVPGAYDISDPADPPPHRFRCPHVHVKVWVGGRDVLTTQLYFPDDPLNAADRWFSRARVLEHRGDGVWEFDLVVDA